MAAAEMAQHHRPVAEVHSGLHVDGPVGWPQRRGGHAGGELRVEPCPLGDPHLTLLLQAAGEPGGRLLVRPDLGIRPGHDPVAEPVVEVVVRVHDTQRQPGDVADRGAQRGRLRVGGQRVDHQRAAGPHDQGHVDVEDRVPQDVGLAGDLAELLRHDWPNARSTNRCRSTSARSTRPSATTSVPSWTETSNVSRRPSTLDSRASATTVRPTGVAARWSSSTRVPTVVAPGGSFEAVAATVAASARASTLGVPSTGTSPEPIACAVSASVTVSCTRAIEPTQVAGVSGGAAEPGCCSITAA